MPYANEQIPRYAQDDKQALGSGLVHLPSKVRFHRGPFPGNDAVDAGIAQRSVGCDLMVAEDAVELRAQAFDAAAALVIEEMRAELHRDALQFFKSVSQQEKLTLRIVSGALGAFPVPGRADLDTAVRGVHVHVGRHAHGATVRV